MTTDHVELTQGHLEELLRLLNESRDTPGRVSLPREGVNLLIDRVAALEAAAPKLPVRHMQAIIADPARGDGHDTNGVPGDCWKACIATLLGVTDYDSVPHFVAHEDWWGETHSYVWTQTGKVLQKWRDPKFIPEGLEFFIGTGPSPRGDFHHAVIVDREGNLVHDPHPSGLGILSVEDYFAPVVHR